MMGTVQAMSTKPHIPILPTLAGRRPIYTHVCKSCRGDTKHLQGQQLGSAAAQQAAAACTRCPAPVQVKREKAGCPLPPRGAKP